MGGPEEIAEKIMRHSESLGGVEIVSFQMDNDGLTHEQMKEAISLLGEEVKPLLKM